MRGDTVNGCLETRLNDVITIQRCVLLHKLPGLQLTDAAAMVDRTVEDAWRVHAGTTASAS